MMPRHLLKITDCSRQEIETIIDFSQKLKKELQTTGQNKPVLERKSLATIYEKPSLRTRISFEVGMTQLGGHSLYLGPGDIQMGQRESAHDIGVVTSSMVDIIMARTFKHETVQELAIGSSVPVINGLSDHEHPCQVLADFLTIQEKFGRMTDLKITFIGDGNNNVTNSLVLLASLFGNEVAVAAPKGFQVSEPILKEAHSIAGKTKTTITLTDDPTEAIDKADVVITDTWVSMGAEKEKEMRLRVFQGFQVTKKLMAGAHRQAIFMHCLPAYRGKEVAAEVIDGPHSVVFQEAENRLHAQKGLLLFLMGVAPE